VLQVLGSWLVHHYLHTDSVYGVFGIVLGLLAWIYLAVQVTVYAAEINVVLSRRLWPRSIVQPPLTEAEAVELFCARSRLEPDDDIGELCRRLDDLPLAVELAGKGVRVNAVAPGFVMTPMLARFIAASGAGTDPAALEEARRQMGRMAPLGRMGEPEDVAHAVLYLACDASSFLTGQIVRPNGGVSMP